MSASTQAHQTSEGIAFSVQVDYVMHECLITEEALKKLAALGKADGEEVNNLAIFEAYEAKINGIARRLVAAGVKGTPLRVNAASLI
jgi:imidazolonepropionase-like amidohydrolase